MSAGTRRALRDADDADPDDALMRIADAMTDVRGRLQHLGQLAERAALQVLDRVDSAQPDCLAIRDEGRDLAARLQAAAQEAPPALAALLARAQGFADRSASVAERQHEALGEIMLSQDFQDLSGQLIRNAEQVLVKAEDRLRALRLPQAPVESCAPPPARPGALEGPQVAGKAMNQGDVDGLLAAMGL